MTAHCAGLTCDRIVDEPGRWCSSCWPAVNTARETDQQIRYKLAAAGFRLAFGPESDRAEAILTISHLIFVLTQYNQQKEETQCTSQP